MKTDNSTVRPTPQQKTAFAAIKAQLVDITNSIDKRFIGPIGVGIVAPLRDSDARKLTWERLLTVLIMRKIEKCALKYGLTPSVQGCWFIQKVSR
jgi:hypothetical protein